MDELTDLSKKLDTTGNDRVWGELEARMNIIHTTISTIEDSISKYETQLAESHLREHEAQYGDQDQPASSEGEGSGVESS